MGENGRACEWAKANQTGSPDWYLYALGVTVFSWCICHTPPGREHSWGLGHPQTPKSSRSEATALLPGRALLPNREQCRTKQEAEGTFPGMGPSHIGHFKPYPFPLARTTLPSLRSWQNHTGAAGLQAGGCADQSKGMQGCEINPPAKQRALQISPVLNIYCVAVALT